MIDIVDIAYARFACVIRGFVRAFVPAFYLRVSFNYAVVSCPLTVHATHPSRVTRPIFVIRPSLQPSVFVCVCAVLVIQLYRSQGCLGGIVLQLPIVRDVQ